MQSTTLWFLIFMYVCYYNHSFEITLSVNTVNANLRDGEFDYGGERVISIIYM